jgi:hypothetical protein
MVEFRIHSKQTKKTFSELGTQRGPAVTQGVGGVSNKYTIQFNNMFANVANAKPGCRSCRGTF